VLTPQAPISWEEVDVTPILKDGKTVIPDRAIESVKKNTVALKGPLATPSACVIRDSPVDLVQWILAPLRLCASDPLILCPSAPLLLCSSAPLLLCFSAPLLLSSAAPMLQCFAAPRIVPKAFQDSALSPRSRQGPRLAQPHPPTNLLPFRQRPPVRLHPGFQDALRQRQHRPHP
jgi:hypothetical protein